ncbi:MAG: dihydroxyacetone kinase subunit DhaL [Terriglobia bacterium]|jgi:dihydroxyacetone kinase-like protein
MAPNSINAADLRQMFAFVSETMVREEAYLTSLDAAIGDGDHGITMRVGFNAIKQKLGGLAEGVGVDTVLREAGFSFMGATGGAIGVLLGKMLMAAGSAMKGQQEIGGAEFRTFMSSMEAALVAAGKAKPGDKTLLDAVHAANEALTVETQPDLLSALTKASEGARRGAESTAQMPARIGRSSRLGDRALGNPDPGAISFAIILRAMTEWLQKQSPSAD